jgi:two-component system cell cycle response regulator CtrA
MDEPELKIIDVFICKLRKKLALAGAGDVIGTVWGRGYVVREQAAADPMPVTGAADRADLRALQPAG